jgi:hypothetical protein
MRFRGFHEGQIVATIFMHANHTNTDKDVYSLEVDGRERPGRFAAIEEARRMGETIFTGSRE